MILNPKRMLPPVAGCNVCSYGGKDVLLSLPLARVILPATPHIAPADGGHLYVVPKVHVASRLGLTPRELLAVDWGTLLAAEAMSRVFGADWCNFQENGNWSLDSGTPQHMHMHVYGRRRDSAKQPFGEALRFTSKRRIMAEPEPSPTKTQRAELATALNVLMGSSFEDYQQALVAGDDTSIR